MLQIESGGPGSSLECDGDDEKVGILTMERRGYRGGSVCYYHIPCYHRFYRMVERLPYRWIIKRVRMISLTEAEMEEYRCDNPECSKFLFERVL